MNFDKDPRQYTEEEIFDRIKQYPPQFGVLLSYELIRRIEVENAKSSEKFARGSMYLSLTAILVSFIIGTIQIYLNTL